MPATTGMIATTWTPATEGTPATGGTRETTGMPATKDMTVKGTLTNAYNTVAGSQLTQHGRQKKEATPKLNKNSMLVRQ
jgi:hypothetical protein